MKKIFFTILIGGILCLPSFAQSSKEIRGDKYYQTYAYSEAINIYEQVPVKSVDLKRKLAESYYNIGDFVVAENYYEQIVDDKSKKADDLYNYASILRINKKYELADQWMEKFNQANPKDIRGQINVERKGEYKSLLDNNGFFVTRNLSINTPEEDFGPSFYKNQVVFSSSRYVGKKHQKKWSWKNLPFLDVYIANREENYDLKNVQPFKPAKNKKYHEGPIAFNKAGDYMVFTRNNYKGRSAEDIVKLQMFSSELVEGEWTKPKKIPFNSSEYSVGHATLTADGKTMYFASDMPGGKGGVDIYMSTRNDDGQWGTPVNMGDKINTEGNEMFPFIHESDFLFFSSDGHAGLGGMDVFFALVLGENSVSSISNIGAPINSNKDDFGYILNSEQTNGYFSSNRVGGKGDDDIYSFRTTATFEAFKIVKGVISNAEGEILANSDVYLYSSKDEELGMITTGPDGEYEFDVQWGEKYYLLGTQKGYVDKKNEFEAVFKESEYVADLVLEKDVEFIDVTAKQDNTEILEASINAIYFDFNKFELRTDAIIELDKIVDLMNQYPDMVIALESYTDSRGTKAFNRWLSNERASATANYIKARINNPERVQNRKGGGESKLLNECDDTHAKECREIQHQKNRRTEFKIVSLGEANIKINNYSPNSFIN